MSSSPAPEVDLVGTAEVIAELDVDRATLIRWVKAGIAKPAMRLPGTSGAYLFARSEIERLRALRAGRKQMPRVADLVERGEVLA
jgi:DNA-binding transcriptional MerR regulator